MNKVLIIGAGGVGNVVAHKCAMVPEIFGEITLASLSPVLLHQKPSRIAYLFIGINPSSSGDGTVNALDARIRPAFQQIQNVMYKQHNVVVEVMDLLDAVGTFNVLNAEDRMVAAALLLDPTVTDDEEDNGG